jgi:ketosteroid isomerase-like protein
MAKRSEECGFACGLGSALADGVYYLHNGMPILHGAQTARSFLQAQDTLLSHWVQWQPLDARLSADATFGITWGVTSAGLRGGPVRLGRYITAWRREGGAWRIAAHVQTALNDAASVSRPDGWQPPALPPLSPPAAIAPFVEADRAFAAQAAREGAAAAFAAWAAPDAVLFGPTELIRGPDAIRQAFAGPASQWQWEPVGAGGAVDGSLGFTVGEATIRRTLPDGREVTSRSKYLTIWTRMPDGEVRFLVDGGNSR